MKQLMLIAALATALHITPAVVLVKRPDAVQALLPGPMCTSRAKCT